MAMAMEMATTDEERGGGGGGAPESDPRVDVGEFSGRGRRGSAGGGDAS